MLKIKAKRSLGVRLVDVRHTRESRRRTQFSETWELQQDAGFTSRQLFDAEFTARPLKDAEFTSRQLFDERFTLRQLNKAGVSPRQLFCSMQDSLCGS